MLVNKMVLSLDLKVPTTFSLHISGLGEIQALMQHVRFFTGRNYLTPKFKVYKGKLNLIPLLKDTTSLHSFYEAGLKRASCFEFEGKYGRW